MEFCLEKAFIRMGTPAPRGNGQDLGLFQTHPREAGLLGVGNLLSENNICYSVFSQSGGERRPV